MQYQWRRFILDNDVKGATYQYPDSSRSYSFDKLVKRIRAGEDELVFVEDKDQKKFVEILTKLKHARMLDSNKDIINAYDALITLTPHLHLSEYDKNTILNAIQIDKNKFKLQNTVKYTLRDVILFILFAEPKRPIYGRVLMTKQVFLVINEILGNENVENPKFVPYNLGPYSFQLIHVLSNMAYDGLVLVRGKKNTASEKFSLSNRGNMLAQEKFKRLTEELQCELIDRRRGWDQSHRKGILAYVYNKYPEYTTKSKVSNIYKSVTWGRGKG